ncbi:MAG: hypothetical protein ABI831_12395 [Betaproteobacteria bacterium]
MYISDEPTTGRVEPASFAGLAADPDEKKFRDSFAAIKAALELNPKGGYVKGSTARKKLEDAFESVPQCLALRLAQYLMDSDGPTASLFRYRLHDETQKTMLLILLARKAKECLEMQRAELRRREEEQRRRQEEEKRRRESVICAKLKETDSVVDELCRQEGDTSDVCREQRSRARKNREETRAEGVRCP